MPVSFRRPAVGAVVAAGNQCRRQRLELKGRPLLTLFTTFRDSPDRRRIHRNTINNWSKLRSFGVQPLLYVVNRSSSQNDTDWSAVEHARRSGWIVRPYHDVSTAASRHVSQAPILRLMFVDAERTYRYAHGHVYVYQWFKDWLSTYMVGRKTGPFQKVCNFCDPHYIIVQSSLYVHTAHTKILHTLKHTLYKQREKIK